jgi:lipopolysaccharide export system permease protein
LFPWFPLDRLDRYALRLITGPFAMALAALLLAQLLERLLRLFDLAASAGAPPSSVLVMAATLVPHYLGLALPMAFTAAIFMATAHMCDDNELDVMLVAGRSIARVAAPYFAMALLLCVFSLYLYGQLQPLARYGYHVAVNRVLQTGWDARVEENRFIDIGKGVTFSADVIEGDGRDLRGVLMERRKAGKEEVLTAARGRLLHTPDGLQLQLEDGQIVRERDTPGVGGTAISVSRFAHGVSGRDFAPTVEPVGDRGASVRERTLSELWQDMQPGPGGGQAKSAAEFHGRIARAMTFPFLPLLALPLGMASKRGRRTPGVVFAVIALLAIHHALQLGSSLAESGRLPAAAAVWTPFAVFAVTSLWIFRSSLAWPGDNPVLRAVVAIEAWVDRARTRQRPKSAA